MKSEKKVEKSKVELRIELDEKEWQECVRTTANKLAAGINVPGFRPGKADYEIIKQKFGEAEIIKEAANPL